MKLNGREVKVGDKILIATGLYYPNKTTKTHTGVILEVNEEDFTVEVNTGNQAQAVTFKQSIINRDFVRSVDENLTAYFNEEAYSVAVELNKLDDIYIPILEIADYEFAKAIVTVLRQRIGQLEYQVSSSSTMPEYRESIIREAQYYNSQAKNDPYTLKGN